MAENIVGGLFGITPDQLNRQNLEQERQRAVEFAQLSPFERANMGMYQAGGQIARLGAGLMGIQTGQEEMASQQHDIQRQIDHSTPEGLMQGAQLFNQAGNPRMAFMYQQAAVAKQQEIANLQRTQAQEQLARAQAEKAGREEDMTKYGRLQKVEIGVEGKPDFRQQALYDPLTGKTTNIGAPYRVTAAITAEAQAAKAERKSQEAEDKTAKGKNTVSALTGMLKEYYDNLDKMGAIVSTHRSVVDNARAQAMLSNPGQMLGGAAGTEAQKNLNQITSTRPLLLNAIKEATGMTAKQMDSNVELQMYLRSATDPKLGYEANIEALKNLDKLYGLGMFEQKAQTPPQNDLAAAAKAELERRRKGK